ncbi:zinc knuckle, partial [Trichinella nativa]
MSREKGVCYKCLKTGHRARECRNGRPCGVDGCRRPHHQLLHSPAARESARSPGP